VSTSARTEQYNTYSVLVFNAFVGGQCSWCIIDTQILNTRHHRRIRI
jgi:hypothetical protein